MSNEKDGTEVPPPDGTDDSESDVTNVRALPSIANADDDEEIVTKVKPIDEIETQVKDPPTQRRADMPPRLPGVPAAVAELSPEPEAEPEEEIQTMDDADVETVDDDAVLEEVPDEPPAPAVPGALDVALADAQNLQGETAHLRLIAIYEKELEVLARSEAEKPRTAHY